jgi:hypothetical protein
MKPYVNKVYPLDVERVRLTVDAKIAEHTKQMISRSKEAVTVFKKWKKTPHLFSRRPSTPITVRKMYKSWIDLERTYYAKVRVVRIGTKKWILVYGDVDNTTIKSGTGPFKTLTKAQDWFFKQGR